MEAREISTPVNEEVLSSLKLGDALFISGRVFTARDRAHKRILEHLGRGARLPFDVSGGVMYHCGPVVELSGGSWRVVSAGPTTSARMERYIAALAGALRFKLLLGKGGLSGDGMRRLAEQGAIYCAITGGAGAMWASKVKRVVSVHWLDLGTPEAVWELEVERLGPVFVASDLSGRSLYEEARRWDTGRASTPSYGL